MNRTSRHSVLSVWHGIIAGIFVAQAEGAFAQFGTGSPGNRASEAPTERPRRDLTGVWGRISPAGVFSSGSTWTEEPPSLTSWGNAKFAEARNSNAGGYTLAETNDPVLTKCYPPGVPRVYFHPYPFEFIESENSIVMLYEYDHTVRRIYTDGREHPDPDIRVPLWLGHSIGQWQDDYTFVVDTVSFNDRTWLDRSGTPHSEDLRVVEVFRRVDPRNLEIEITMIDPIALAEPWTAKLYYRLAPDWELGEISCSGDYLEFANFEDFSP